MPTKYDVFARVIEKAPCKQKDLGFKTLVYSHLTSLLKDKWIRKNTKGDLIPLKNKETEQVFELIRLSLKNNLDYNIFFSQNFPKVLITLSKAIPQLNPKETSHNKINGEIINFLGKNQFMIIWKKRPKLGTLLNHSIFEIIKKQNLSKFNIKEKFQKTNTLINSVLKIPKKEVNPFDTNVFEFLTGSAQLEGSTVSIGETVDLILKEIYPNKPAEDVQMVKNLNEALRYTLEHLEEDLTIEHIKEVNRLCLFSLHRGAGMLKKVQNKITGNPNFKTTFPNNVLPELEKFCKIFNNIQSREDCLKHIGFIHNQHQRIHPFVDGNSRTTRILVSWLLMKFGFPLLVLKVGAFEKYMNLTKLSIKRDDYFLTNFLLHIIYHEELMK